jgi:hypothetical protein
MKTNARCFIVNVSATLNIRTVLPQSHDIARRRAKLRETGKGELTVLRKFRRGNFLGGLLEPRRRALLAAEFSDACKETFELCFVIRFSSRLALRFFRLAHTCALPCASSLARFRIIAAKLGMSTRYQYIRTGLNCAAEALLSAPMHASCSAMCPMTTLYLPRPSLFVWRSPRRRKTTVGKLIGTVISEYSRRNSVGIKACADAFMFSLQKYDVEAPSASSFFV